jgi:hypothetical protein
VANEEWGVGITYSQLVNEMLVSKVDQYWIIVAHQSYGTRKVGVHWIQ